LTAPEKTRLPLVAVTVAGAVIDVAVGKVAPLGTFKVPLRTVAPDPFRVREPLIVEVVPPKVSAPEFVDVIVVAVRSPRTVKPLPDIVMLVAVTAPVAPKLPPEIWSRLGGVAPPTLSINKPPPVPPINCKLCGLPDDSTSP